MKPDFTQWAATVIHEVVMKGGSNAAATQAIAQALEEAYKQGKYSDAHNDLEDGDWEAI